jgi:protein-disulfide isomerase
MQPSRPGLRYVMPAALGLDADEVLRPGSEQHDAKVREDFQSGVDSGVQGTPGLFVNELRLLRTPTPIQLLDAVDRVAAP